MELDYIKNRELTIEALDSLRPYDRSTAEDMLRTSKNVCDWNMFLLDVIKKKDNTDWIVVDGIERYTEIGENAGRFELKLDKYQGTANQIFGRFVTCMLIIYLTSVLRLLKLV